MAIRTCNHDKGQALSSRSPIRTLLESTLAAAMDWIARKKDASGNRIGKVTHTDGICKWDKDTFSLYGRCGDKTVSLNDIRGKAIFLRRLPDGRMYIADYFLFCTSVGQYILTSWNAVWRVIDKLTHDHGTVIYKDAWRFDRNRFVALLQKEISGEKAIDRHSPRSYYNNNYK